MHGIELAYAEFGAGSTAVLCLHETAATSASWRKFAASLAEQAGGARVITYDRRGWARSGAPEPYTRTTVTEQAEDGAMLLDELGAGPALLCGVGLGAVAALDLAAREPQQVLGVLAVEPPLLALSPEATEGLSADVAAVSKAAEESGARSVVDLYLAGELPYLGPGAERVVTREASGGGDGLAAKARPISLFAELAAVSGWPMPLTQWPSSTVPVRIITGSATPAPLAEVAPLLAARIAGAIHLVVDAPDPLCASALLPLALDLLA